MGQEEFWETWNGTESKQTNAPKKGERHRAEMCKHPG